MDPDFYRVVLGLGHLQVRDEPAVAWDSAADAKRLDFGTVRRGMPSSVWIEPNAMYPVRFRFGGGFGSAASGWNTIRGGPRAVALSGRPVTSYPQFCNAMTISIHEDDEVRNRSMIVLDQMTTDVSEEPVDRVFDLDMMRRGLNPDREERRAARPGLRSPHREGGPDPSGGAARGGHGSGNGPGDSDRPASCHRVRRACLADRAQRAGFRTMDLCHGTRRSGSFSYRVVQRLAEQPIAVGAWGSTVWILLSSPHADGQTFDAYQLGAVYQASLDLDLIEPREGFGPLPPLKGFDSIDLLAGTSTGPLVIGSQDDRPVARRLVSGQWVEVELPDPGRSWSDIHAAGCCGSRIVRHRLPVRGGR